MPAFSYDLEYPLLSAFSYLLVPCVAALFEFLTVSTPSSSIGGNGVHEVVRQSADQVP